MLDRNAFDRVATLADYGLMDSGREPVFDTIVTHAAQLTATPISTISLVDDSRQWFKAKVGIDGDNLASAESICARVIQGEGLLVVPDAREDRRFSNLPSVTGAPGVRFYAGMPLKLHNGVQIGTLCVIDVEPRSDFDEADRQALAMLARRTVAAIEMRQRSRIRWAFQGNLGSLDDLLRDEARTALLTASAALEQAGDLLPLALLDDVIALVDASIERGSGPDDRRH